MTTAAAPATHRQVFDSLDELSRAAAAEFVVLARAKAGAFHVALSGGSTPKRLFQELAKVGAAIPWDRVHLWWGDERCVPPEHPDSNYGMTRAALIAPLALDASRVHRIAGERPAEDAARDYERELTAALGTPPVFDLLYLGMGPDGHTASLFPGSPGLAETQRFVIANAVDSPLTKGRATRITLTYPALDAAKHTRFLVCGNDKAAMLARVVRGDTALPSARVTGADVVWMLDKAAASLLPEASR
jgi:6-phosphogluconolactonase